jgi:hypothetical protein
MKTNRPVTLAILALTLAALSCNLPNAQPTEGLAPNEQAGTIAALTLTAQAKSIIPAATSAPSATMTLTATATLTPTYAPASLVISSDTNCRSGPGQSYEILTVLKPGTKAEILGRYAGNTYWIIQNPNGEGICWAWSEFATPGGSFDTAPEMTPPPTPTQNLPAPPRTLTYEFLCTYTDVTVTLNWIDVAVNESGYRIYRNGFYLIELGAGATSYVDVAPASPGSGFTYSVEAFNNTGASSPATISFACP